MVSSPQLGFANKKPIIDISKRIRHKRLCFIVSPFPIDDEFVLVIPANTGWVSHVGFLSFQRTLHLRLHCKQDSPRRKMDDDRICARLAFHRNHRHGFDPSCERAAEVNLHYYIGQVRKVHDEFLTIKGLFGFHKVESCKPAPPISTGSVQTAKNSQLPSPLPGYRQSATQTWSVRRSTSRALQENPKFIQVLRILLLSTGWHEGKLNLVVKCAQIG